MFAVNFLSFLKQFQSRDKSVLVVDDDPLLRPIMEKALKSVDPGIQMYWASSVEEAWTVLQGREVSMIISDFLFGPGETGLTLWRRCQEVFPKIPFLLISGLERKTIDRLLGASRSSLNVLHKPFYVRECADQIKNLIGK